VPSGTDPASYLQTAFSKQIGARPQNIQSFDINGMRAASGIAQGQTDSGTVVVKMTLVLYSPEQMYRFLCVASPSNFNAREPGFDQTARSLQRVSAEEAGAVKPLRIRIVTAGAVDTVQSLASRMGFENYREERFRVLNGLDPGVQVKAGERYKIIQ
jgi:predicted Zn-dependent protease